MLSNEDIKLALTKNEIIISPFSNSQLRSCGITLHLGHNLLKPQKDSVIDVKYGKNCSYQDFKISDIEPYTLQSGEFLLAHTLEEVTLSTKHSLLIEGRSTLARVGLTIVQTAMLVEPGHSGRAITLELVNHGPNPINLYPKMKIARALIFELHSHSTEPYDIDGKYKDQKIVGQPLFLDEFQEE
jgi:dCTP deaminase